MDDSLKYLAEQIDKKGLKVTFGLQPKDLEIIEKELSIFPRAKYNYHIWKTIGKKIGWDALTAALYYFELQDKKI